MNVACLFLIDETFVSTLLDFSFFCTIRKKKETGKEGLEDVRIREPEC